MNLKEMRRSKGLTQEKLAELLGIHENTLRTWEKGIHEPRSSDIKKICEVFQCTEAELLNSSNEKQVKITISYDWNKMKEADIDMFSENFDLIIGANGAIGIKGAGTMTSREAINDFVLRIKDYLETGFEAQEKLKKEDSNNDKCNSDF